MNKEIETKVINHILDNFTKNVDSIKKLVNFDDLVQRLCLNALSKAEKGLKRFKAEKHPNYSVEGEIKSITSIRTHESLRPYYEVMFNQCVVLLVSYFASAVEDIFQISLTHKIRDGHLGKLGKEEIKISLSELKQIDFNVLDNIGQIIATFKDISFQDMQSIARAFNNYLDYEPTKDKDVNNIILSQACRHSIVHSGGVINDKIAKQISNARPRDLKKELKASEQVQFHPGEIEIISKSMICYIEKLVSALNDIL